MRYLTGFLAVCAMIALLQNLAFPYFASRSVTTKSVSTSGTTVTSNTDAVWWVHPIDGDIYINDRGTTANSTSSVIVSAGGSYMTTFGESWYVIPAGDSVKMAAKTATTNVLIYFYK